MINIELTIEEIETVAALVRFTAIAHPNLIQLDPDIFQSIYNKTIAAAKISPEKSKFDFKVPHNYYDEMAKMQSAEEEEKRKYPNAGPVSPDDPTRFRFNN